MIFHLSDQRLKESPPHPDKMLLLNSGIYKDKEMTRNVIIRSNFHRLYLKFQGCQLHMDGYDLINFLYIKIYDFVSSQKPFSSMQIVPFRD